MPRVSILVLAIVLFLCASEAAAGGFSISILGGRRTGMLANLAAPDDLTALFHNPAGLADQPGWRAHLSTSVTFLGTDFRMKGLDPERYPDLNPAGCGGAGAKPCPWPLDDKGYYRQKISPEKYFGVLPYLGLSRDLDFLGARDVVVSLAVTAPNLYGAFLPESAPTAYNFISGYFAVISTTLGAGWKVNRHLSLGASVSYNYMRLAYAQRISLADMLRGKSPTDQDKAIADAAQALIGDLRIDYTGVDHGAGWNLGALVRPTDWLAFGFSYNGATSARFVGGLSFQAVGDPSLDVRGLAAGLDRKLPRRLAVEMPIPHSIQAGMNLRPAAWAEIGFDARFWLYNLYTRQVIDPMYDPAEPGQPVLTTEDMSRDKHYGLSYELALGALFRPWPAQPGFKVMTGVAFDKSPVPDESFSLDNPSMNQIVATAGVRWQFALHWRMAASYMFDYYLPRDITTSQASPPVNVKGRGIGQMPRLEVEVLY